MWNSALMALPWVVPDGRPGTRLHPPDRAQAFTGRCSVPGLVLHTVNKLGSVPCPPRSWALLGNK